MQALNLPKTPPPISILLVDDDELLRRSLGYSLEQAGYQVLLAANASDAIGIVRQASPSLVLLDIGLPDMNGLEAFRRIQELCPVIFVSGRQRQLEEILGLELGAQDYISKPFDPDVLLARIRSVLRRTTPGSSVEQPAPSGTTLVVGDLSIDTATHTVTCAQKTIHLSPLEFRLLYVLAQNAKRVVSAEELLERVWGEHYVGEPQIVYVYMRTLRAKLSENPQAPQRILTVRGIGYRLVPHGEAIA